MESIDREKFGGFVAARRKKLGLTQQELADKLFISNKAVSKWETGQSLPDIALLEPLAQCLGVSVAELLRGERIEERPLEPEETETLVGRAIQFADGDQGAKGRKKRRRWGIAWAASLAVGVWGMAALFWAGFSKAELASTVLLVETLCPLFGLWAVFFAPARLPQYYDENKISSFSQGPFRMNLAFVRIHNGNWPHILAALRWWLVVVPAAYPLLYGLLRAAVPGWTPSWELGVTLTACLGMFIPVIVLAKKYE